MPVPFLTTNDVKLGKATPNGFTLEVNGFEPIECTYDMKFEKEPVRRNNRITGKYKTVCYPKYYIVVEWNKRLEFFKATSLDQAKEHIARKLNEDFEYKNKRD